MASEGMTAREMVMMTLVRPFTLNFLEPMVFLLNLYMYAHPLARNITDSV